MQEIKPEILEKEHKKRKFESNGGLKLTSMMIVLLINARLD